MIKAVGLDVDGTILRTWTDEPLKLAVRAIKRLPEDITLFLATNQAGPLYRRVLSDETYPARATR